MHNLCIYQTRNGVHNSLTRGFIFSLLGAKGFEERVEYAAL